MLKLKINLLVEKNTTKWKWAFNLRVLQWFDSRHRNVVQALRPDVGQCVIERHLLHDPMSAVVDQFRLGNLSRGRLVDRWRSQKSRSRCWRPRLPDAGEDVNVHQSSGFGNRLFDLGRARLCGRNLLYCLYPFWFLKKVLYCNAGVNMKTVRYRQTCSIVQ